MNSFHLRWDADEMPPFHLFPLWTSIVICAQVILGYGRVRSVHQMYTSFSWEMEDAFEVASELWQPSLCCRDAIGLEMWSSEGSSWIGTDYVGTLMQSDFKCASVVHALHIATQLLRTFPLESYWLYSKSRLRAGTQMGLGTGGHDPSPSLSLRKATSVNRGLIRVFAMYISLSSGSCSSLNVHWTIFEKCSWLQCLTESEKNICSQSAVRGRVLYW